ncbi:hypothetical protein H257_13451 [Aphanomyces astaci]|uniref:Uncharacterized protein n=1 Tax=Aphanomyces astaci TaxID=112090 RepID=W4FWZ8_APHAT|nr:hypothetical protein H257_13451 [Aphanomyces astaci]ETV71324.1 hypothetical protein H257_13451 [Aphanomyces astaci]|eukprot:XP_009839264.1 hypothetical protein H257_13451 [Aphanomyces astaci]
MQPSLFSASPIEAAFARQNARIAARSVAGEGGEGAGGDCVGGHPRKRKLQQVVTISDRVRVMRWMINDALENGEKGVNVRTIAKFPAQFRGEYKKSVSGLGNSTRKVAVLKAVSGRGPKTAPWVLQTHDDLYLEFRRLKALGVKFSASLLRLIAKDVIRQSDLVYNSAYIDQMDQKPIMEKITPRWIQLFMERYNIMYRSQTGKLLVSPQKLDHIERSVAYHFGVLHRGFESGQYD